MIIKKFIAPTQSEAESMAKAELGNDAIVMNVKTIKPNGLFKMFKKMSVEVTAAIDDNIVSKDSKKEVRKDSASTYKFGEVFMDSNQDEKNADDIIESKINTLARLLDQQKLSSKTGVNSRNSSINGYSDMNTVSRHEYNEEISVLTTNKTDDRTDNHSEFDDRKSVSSDGAESKLISLVKEQLMDNEVSYNNVNAIIDELEISKSNHAVDAILSSVYQKIILKLGQIDTLKLSENKPKIIFFVGNTGVGKTTTMAKIASKCTLEDKMKVAMFSVDTYRIAAIDQIKTYANILSTPMEVIYTADDMQKYVEKYGNYDLIMVDTAGRSHTNESQKNDLLSIINSVSDYEKEIYLVVSATTKYSDLKNISKSYGELFDYKLIFTKLDETRGIGNILNLKLDTGKSLSYVTWGQNVPDDIGEVNPQVIAKKLLGGAD